MITFKYVTDFSCAAICVVYLLFTSVWMFAIGLTSRSVILSCTISDQLLNPFSEFLIS